MRQPAPDRTGAPTVALALVLATLFSSAPTQAQIYRCVDADGRSEFSDLPCADDAEILQPGGNLSVIARAESLDAAAIANRQFIDQRRADLAEQRRATVERQRREHARQRDATARMAQKPLRSTPLSLQDQRRLQAQRRAERAVADQRRREQAAAIQPSDNRRETLLSRSGGNRERVLD